MLAMEQKMFFFLFATSILLCARRGHAMVPQPYEELLAKLADKYGYEMAERNVETRAFNKEKEGNVLFIIVFWNLYLKDFKVH